MKITIYTVSDCQFSKAEKEYLKQHNLQYEEKNLEQNREWLTEMLAVSNNFAGTPVTKIEKDDGTIVVLKGFTQGEFDQELGLNQTQTIDQTTTQINPPLPPVSPSPSTPTSPPSASSPQNQPVQPLSTNQPVSTSPSAFPTTNQSISSSSNQPAPTPSPTFPPSTPTPNVNQSISNPNNNLNKILQDLHDKAQMTNSPPSPSPSIPPTDIPNIPDFKDQNQ